MFRRLIHYGLLSLCTLMLSFAHAEKAFAQTWNEITEFYIDNPSFDSGLYGWNLDVSYYQNGGVQGAYYTNNGVDIWNFLEVWTPSPNTLGSGKMSQTRLLPAGTYRIEMDGIATRQSSYANSDVKNVSGVTLDARSSGKVLSTTKLGTGNGAPERFTTDFTISSKREVEFGAFIAEGTDANWVAIDNFKLYKSGSFVPLLGMGMSSTKLNLELGETVTLTESYIPDNATYQRCQWTSTDTDVATVDENGLVTAVGKGTAIIHATSLDGSVESACEVTVSFSGTASASSLLVNELQASNIDMFMDPSYNYGSWIELYNPSDSPVPLVGLYITDDPNNLKKHKLTSYNGVVPAKGFKNIWFDHYGRWNTGELAQVNFKLNYDGGTIILSDGADIILQQDYPAAISRTSYARTTDGGSTWGVSGAPTPEASNAGMQFAEKQLAPPVVDLDACVYSSTLSINVSIPAGVTLRYTTDGTTPTMTNGMTSSMGFFTHVRGNHVYRFRLFQDGYLPSDPVTRTYLYSSSSFKLPIVSVVTDPASINDSHTGLFKSGTMAYGRPGNGQSSKCNWNMDWDRPVNFEYFDIDEDGKYFAAFNQEVDMSMCGGWSRAWTPHSFKLKAAKYYEGKNSMDYQFFKAKPFLKHKTLQLRNGGNDNNCRLKDAALQEIVRRSGFYVDGQAWQPAHVYINGSFHGILNIREPNNKHFAYANYGIDTDFMDQFEICPDSGYVQMEGTKESFNRLYELSKDANDKVVYDSICRLLDIDEFINYMAVEFYLGGTDWPQNNLKGFRDQDNGKFHFVLFDLDHAFSTTDVFNQFSWKQNRTCDRLYGTDALGNVLDGKQLQVELEVVTIFKNLLQNPTFCKKFVDTFCLVAGSVFEPTRCKEIINEMADILTSGGLNPATTANELRNNLSASRQNTMVNNLKNSSNLNFGISGITPQSVVLNSSVEGAQLLVNGMVVPTDKFSGKLFAPITVTAVAPAGYEFLGWQGSATSGDAVEHTIFTKGSTWDYYDKGSLDNQPWKSATYSITWPNGTAPIGYGKNSVKTTTASNLPTYYFRKTITLDEAPGVSDSYRLDYTIDDGLIIYVNGKEAGRYNMPSGNVTYNTFASTYANDNPDVGSMLLDASLFKKGSNIIAVEVHNNTATSSDILWDASLVWLERKSDGGEYLSEDANFELPSSGNVNITAVYRKIGAEELVAQGVSPVRINEISAGNSIFVNDYFKKDDWVELYNSSDADVDVNGWYLTDNLGKPHKYQITNSDGQKTVVPAHGYLVVWASKRDALGEMIHLSFKLGNADGELLMLSNADATLSDTLTYVAHTGQQSVGVYPDGGNDVYFMDHPTVSRSNMLTSYSKYLYTKQPKAVDDGIVDIYINAANDVNTRMIEMYSIDGVRVTTKNNRGITIVRRADGTVIKASR